MSKNRSRWTARRVHLWVAIVLALPMVVMALSGILIAMRSVTHLQVPLAWLGAEKLPEQLPITAYAEQADGVTWIGNAQGLYRVSAGRAEAIASFAGQEVVALAAPPAAAQPVVATRMAVWSLVDGEWTAQRRGRVRQLNLLPDGRVLVIVGGRGEFADGKPFVSTDGQEWQPYPRAMKTNKALPPLVEPKVALHQFMRELHSGAYFFGKGPGEIAWSNLMGWVLTLLTLTGLWMWLRRERQKARERAATSAPAPMGAPAGQAAVLTAQGEGA